MKKIAALLAASFLIVGCSSSSAPADSVQNSFQNQNQNYEAPAQTQEDRYLSDVKAQNNPDLMDETDATLLEVGYQTCEVLDSGYNVQELVRYLLSDNPTDSEIAYMSIIIGNAIEYFCPEYLSQV